MSPAILTDEVQERNWEVPNVQCRIKTPSQLFFALTLNHPYTILTQSCNPSEAKTAS